MEYCYSSHAYMENVATQTIQGKKQYFKNK